MPLIGRQLGSKSNQNAAKSFIIKEGRNKRTPKRCRTQQFDAMTQNLRRTQKSDAESTQNATKLFKSMQNVAKWQKLIQKVAK